MEFESLKEETKKRVLTFQKTEITEYYIYKKLSKLDKNKSNKNVLEHIAKDELRHYNYWKKFTKRNIEPNMFKLWFFIILCRIFGITFGIKLMEKGEVFSYGSYSQLARSVPIAKNIIEDEDKHEFQLFKLLKEEKLNYVGSIVLGLNDALVELTGALAGFTLAFQNARLIAIAGLITGIAASFSMGASEYLSIKSERQKRNPKKAAFYTGIAYLFTVLFLILPYLILNNVFLSLSITIFTAIFIIFLFTFYSSIAQDLPFKKRFFEMIALSIGIAAITFFIGLLIRKFIGIEI